MKENTNLRAIAVVQHALQHALRVAAFASAVYQIETYTYYKNRFKCLTKRDLGLFLVSCCTTTAAQKRALQRAARVAPPRQHSTSEWGCGGATCAARCGACFCGMSKETSIWDEKWCMKKRDRYVTPKELYMESNEIQICGEKRPT